MILKSLIDIYGFDLKNIPESQHRIYDELTTGFHKDQIDALCKDCIKTFDRFPTVAKLSKLIDDKGMDNYEINK